MMGLPSWGPLTVIGNGEARSQGTASLTFSSDAQAHWRCLAAPVAHLAGHFTIAGTKALTAHAKWIGRYDRRRQTTAWVSPIHPGDASTAAADGAGDAG